MATEVQYTVVDDLDHSTDRVGTYRFALKASTTRSTCPSTTSPGSARHWRRSSPPDGGCPGPAAGPAVPPPPPRTPGPTSAEVRAWWTQHWRELDLPEPRTHGAIPAKVRDAHHAAHSTT
jgi:hypothetical protein